MATDIDAAGVELAALLAAADFAGARVLEVGCGDGRLSRRYAPACRLAVGLDPAGADTWQSGAARPPRFVRGAALPLPFRDEAFDLVIFGWSL